MRQSFIGNIFHELEKINNEKIKHVGFVDKNKEFETFLWGQVPRVGQSKRARITIEVTDEEKRLIGLCVIDCSIVNTNQETTH